MREAETWPDLMGVIHRPIGAMGTGSNFFRCGLVHSSGAIFIGTYGPSPAILWRYDQRSADLVKVGTPGEYQLDCMVEAPDGLIYIGSAYGGLVYQLDPGSGRITSLGSPAMETTPWIFSMVRTHAQEVYGAKGVGLFRLNWREGQLEPIDLVPGVHTTPAPSPSSPVIRSLVEAPDGTLYGDTNRWLFRYHPDGDRIEPLADMVPVDPACYGLFLAQGVMPTDDCYFTLLSRFSGLEVDNPFFVYRADENRVEPLLIKGFTGAVKGPSVWWYSGEDVRLLVQTWHAEEQKVDLSVVDPLVGELVDRWEIDGKVDCLLPLPGDQRYFASANRGRLLMADDESRRLVTLAENPMAVQCRSLAISPRRTLGTDTYDCGHAFTRQVNTPMARDHGKVWRDDHRCNYGPSAFAGVDGRYLLANHSEGTPTLWVTDTQTDRHWSVGPCAIQLVPMRDGTVWGTVGPNPAAYEFDPGRCWIPEWQARRGAVFTYHAGEERVEPLDALGPSGPLVEAPGEPGHVMLTVEDGICVYAPGRGEIIQRLTLPNEVLAAAHDPGRACSYFALSGAVLCRCRWTDGGWHLAEVASGFGPSDRGFFVLPRSGRVLGVAADGMLSVYEPRTDSIRRLQSPQPPPAGPAVDPLEDAWYYADDEVFQYELTTRPGSTAGTILGRKELQA
jgi:hypothetical protein